MGSDCPEKRRVLVVDDDEGMRRLLVRELSCHFEIIVASGYAEAMSVLEKRGGSLAAIVTDRDLGAERSGIDILEAVRTRCLRCVRVVVSGDMDDDLESHLATGELADVAFAKPWPSRAVDRALTDLVARAAG